MKRGAWARERDRDKDGDGEQRLECFGIVSTEGSASFQEPPKTSIQLNSKTKALTDPKETTKP